MDPVSRRSFLVRGSVGAAVAAGSVGGARALVTSSSTPETVLSAGEVEELDQLVMVQIRDAARGEAAVLVGEREVVVNDPALVAKLLRATR